MDVINQEIEDKYAIYNGDSIELIKDIPDKSIHYSIFSPPFASLYTFSNSDRDLSNCKSKEQFIEHFEFIAEELYRVMMPGRLVSIHCCDLPCTINTDGFIGQRDFPGDLIRLFEKVGFYYHSKVTIWKDPFVQATRAHTYGLLHKNVCKDSTLCRQGDCDYIVTMRKPGDNPEPVNRPEGFTEYIGTDEIDPNGIYSHLVWRKYASPVWMDIRQTNTLSVSGSKDNEDERHICPLQLDVIERCIDLWSNPGDIVFDPFMGIGSVPYCAVKRDRYGLGFELKESYFKVAQKNMAKASFESGIKSQQIGMFDEQ